MNKLLSMLGLARRAGKLQMGFDASIEAIRSGNAHGVLASCDLSDKTFKNLKFEADKFGIPAVRIDETTENLSIATGRKAGIAAVCDKGFMEAISKMNATITPPQIERMDTK